jgi:hypothetical protein
LLKREKTQAKKADGNVKPPATGSKPNRNNNGWSSNTSNSKHGWDDLNPGIEGGSNKKPKTTSSSKGNKPKPRTQTTREEQEKLKKEGKCFKYKEKGHMVLECPRRASEAPPAPE